MEKEKLKKYFIDLGYITYLYEQGEISWTDYITERNLIMKTINNMEK